MGGPSARWTVDMLVSETGFTSGFVRLALAISGDPAAVLALAVEIRDKEPDEARRACVDFTRGNLNADTLRRVREL